MLWDFICKIKTNIEVTIHELNVRITHLEKKYVYIYKNICEICELIVLYM